MGAAYDRIRSAAACTGALAAVAAVSVVQGCAGAREDIASSVDPVIYGADDRLEYYEVVQEETRAVMETSVVALVETRFIGAGAAGGIDITAPSWGTLEGLCPDQPFVDQPAAAFCTGVLVDWDLVLTAGHCVRAFALDEFAVVFGYHYVSPGGLGVTERREPVAIVAEALDPAEVEPRLDYAWLRLDRPVTAQRRPAPVRVGDPHGWAPGDPVVSIGAGGGVPIKADRGGKILDVRSGPADYFLANTDTARGSSGGGAFDANMALIGVLVRGERDLSRPAVGGGCATTVRLSDDSGGEAFTYVQRAVEGLCQQRPEMSSLCRRNCGDPCQALPPAMVDGGGCQYGGRLAHRPDLMAVLLLTLAVRIAIARRRLSVARHLGRRSGRATPPAPGGGAACRPWRSPLPCSAAETWLPTSVGEEEVPDA